MISYISLRKKEHHSAIKSEFLKHISGATPTSVLCIFVLSYLIFFWKRSEAHLYKCIRRVCWFHLVFGFTDKKDAFYFDSHFYCCSLLFSPTILRTTIYTRLDIDRFSPTTSMVWWKQSRHLHSLGCLQCSIDLIRMVCHCHEKSSHSRSIIAAGCGGNGKETIQIRTWLILWIELTHLTGLMPILLLNFVRNSTVKTPFFRTIVTNKSLPFRSGWMGRYLGCIWCKVRWFYLFVEGPILCLFYLDTLCSQAKSVQTKDILSLQWCWVFEFFLASRRVHDVAIEIFLQLECYGCWSKTRFTW